MKHDALPPLHILTLENYRPSAHCRGIACTSREGFVPVSCTLGAGKAVGLRSEFGGGAWALTTCIGGRAEPQRQQDGRILWNGQHVTNGELAVRACFVGERPEEHRLKCLYPTVRGCMERALKKSGLPYTAEEIRAMFGLTDARFDRRIDRIGSEIWLASMAIGFAGGKDLYCWPWMYGQFEHYLRVAKELGILDLLRQHGKLVLIPSANEVLLRDCCDCLLRFSGDGTLKTE